MFPMVGGRKVEHLKANIEALSLRLSPEDIADIEKGYEFDPGFPHSFINPTGKMSRAPQDAMILNSLGYFDYVQGPQPTKPHQGETGGPWEP